MSPSERIPGPGKLGLVVIGRNEGERLARCLVSVRCIASRVYVDSGSTDGSIALARGEGVSIVELAVPPPFTAARARNAGLAALLARVPDLEFVQMVDGDCEMQPDWIPVAIAALEAESDLAAVFGRTRERHPERSIYNALCDDEWNVPVGVAAGCGGIAMFRVAALRQVGSFNPAMIAGEDTELAMRLRKAGWRLRRLDAEMALHDANITRFSQWWGRALRSGHAFGEMAFLHPDARDPNWPGTVRSIVTWGAILPAMLLCACVLAIVLKGLWWIAAVAIAAAWPVNALRLALRQARRLPLKVACASGSFLMMGKFAQLIGLAAYHRNRLSGRASELIEYKGAASR
jgi:cellulose synthase/poly-beta-1,6-N-acetylglucosamine synthase-like glycosyltransferase